MSSSSGSRVPTGAKNGGSGAIEARSCGDARGVLDDAQRIRELGRAARARADGHAGTTRGHRGSFHRSSAAACGARENRSGVETSSIAQNGSAARGTTPHVVDLARPRLGRAADIAASVSAVIRLPPADSPATATRCRIAAELARRARPSSVYARARVLDRGRIRMLRREPVADVDDEVAEAREHEAHQPVRVLRQQVERAAVHVEHDRPRLGPVHRAIDVELVASRRAGRRCTSRSTSTPWRFGDAAGCSRADRRRAPSKNARGRGRAQRGETSVVAIARCGWRLGSRRRLVRDMLRAARRLKEVLAMLP